MIQVSKKPAEFHPEPGISLLRILQTCALRSKHVLQVGQANNCGRQPLTCHSTVQLGSNQPPPMCLYFAKVNPLPVFPTVPLLPNSSLGPNLNLPKLGFSLFASFDGSFQVQSQAPWPKAPAGAV